MAYIDMILKTMRYQTHLNETIALKLRTIKPFWDSEWEDKL